MYNIRWNKIMNAIKGIKRMILAYKMYYKLSPLLTIDGDLVGIILAARLGPMLTK